MGSPNEGKYLYGIIGTKDARDFGPIGVGIRGDRVETIVYRDLSAVVSNVPRMVDYAVSREDLLAHQRVLERVMQEYTVLPIKFGTVADSAEEVRWLLEHRYQELEGLLRELEGKVELGVKALWRDIGRIFDEITEESGEVRRRRAEIAGKPPLQTYGQRIALGQMVQAALAAKKEHESEEILGRLRPAAIDYRLNRTVGDRMLLNAAFLVDRRREEEFDRLVEELDLRYRERITFRYVGPVPPYNFVSLAIRLGA